MSDLCTCGHTQEWHLNGYWECAFDHSCSCDRFTSEDEPHEPSPPEHPDT